MSQAFRDLHLSKPVEFTRLIDSKTAGNLIKAQPCDFTFLINTGEIARPYYFMLEAKSSEKYDTFGPCFRSLIKPIPRGLMMIRERAGAKGFYLFYSFRTNEIELWDATVINEAWPLKGKPLNKTPRMVIELANLPNFALHMVKNPAMYATPAI